jgi:hypothetical protein
VPYSNYKNNKALGEDPVTDKWRKHGGQVLFVRIYKLIFTIRVPEGMPSE